MRKLSILTFTLLFQLMGFSFELKLNPEEAKQISFYSVPLECGAAPDIGCGSRAKPVFKDMEDDKSIKESWMNRTGTVIAIVWQNGITNLEERESIAQKYFKKHKVEGILITEKKELKKLRTSFRSGDWYKGMDVDKLSIEEAGIIATSILSPALDKSVISQEEYDLIKPDVEKYFKEELVKIRSLEELKSEELRAEWGGAAYEIIVKYLGIEKANAIFDAYEEAERCKNASCCEKDKKKKKCR